jgi:hypothetical protein
MPKVISPLLFANDNSYSIGAAGASRPNAVYVGGFVAAGLSPYTLTLGSSSGGVYITPSATDVMQFGTAGTPRFNITASGHLLAATDNTYDIGAAGATRPRTVYAATSFIGPGAVPTGGTAGQVLSKVDATNYNLAWITPAGGGGGITLPLGQHLTFSPDATYDIGASGASRPRDIYTSGAVRADNLYANSRLYANSWESTGTNSRMTARMNIDGGTDTLIIINAWANRESVLNVTPAGTGVGGGYRIYHASDVNNSAYLLSGIDATASYLDSNKSGTGVSKGLSLRIQGTERWQISTAGHLLAGADNTYDIGASASGRPRYVYVGTGVITPVVATPLVQSATTLQFYASNVAKRRIHTTGDLWAETDNAFDIGASSSVRPRDLYLAGTANIGSNGQIYSVAGSVPGIVVASTVSTGGAQLASTNTTQITSNALWNGSAWTRITTGAASTLQMLPGAMSFYTAPSAAAAVPPAFATVMSVDVSGNLSVSGNLISNGGNLSVTGNITSTGGNLSIAGGGSFSAYTTFFTPSSAGVADPGSSLGAIQIQPNSGGGASMICFHRPGSYATYFGLDTDNIFRVGGWSAGAVAYRLTLGDGYNNPSLSMGGTNVGTNGVLLSVHANYYGGVYYSTTGSFVTWSQTDHKRNIQPLQTRQLWNRERRTIKYQQMDIDWDDKHPGNYIWHEPKADKPYSYGFDVDEWAADFPELVVDAPGGIKGMNYVGMIPILWEAVRDLRAEIQLLKEKR